MHKYLRTLPIAALLCFACDVDDESYEEIGVGVVGLGLDSEIDGDAVADADLDEDALLGLGLHDPQDPTLVLPAYCNGVVAWDAGWVTLENQVLTLVNQRRAAGATCGGVAKPAVPAVTFNENLRCAARVHSTDMGAKNFFSHTGSNGSTPWQRIKNAGYNYLQAAENIAAGYATAALVVDGWMKSTGHCNNIMNAGLKEIGIGYAYNATATYKHYWTQDFGRK